MVALLALSCGRREPSDAAHRAERDQATETPEAEAARGGEAVQGAGSTAHNQAGQPNQAAAQPLSPDDPRLNPSAANEEPPATYTVRLTTTKGDIFLDVTTAWAPLGARRFYNLVRVGYFTNVAFFRVIEGFMAQTGLSGIPEVDAAWRSATIPDDPVTQSNTRGMVSFATSGENSRVQQFFINFGDNSRLDGMGFSPFGRVRNMEVVDQIFAGHGERPNQGLINREGNPYLRANFPELDYILSASIVSGE